LAATFDRTLASPEAGGRAPEGGRLPGLLGAIESPLLRYVVRRLLWTVVVLALVIFLTYLVFYTLPSSDPAQLRAGRLATPELVAAIREKYGLDKPFYEQFWIYAKGVVLHFDLGYSYYNNVSVKDEIFSRLPASISVALGAFVLWMLIALPVGILTAVRPRSVADRAVTGGTLFFLSAPTYWLGLVLLFLFAKDIGRFPLVGGVGTYTPISQDVAKWFESLLMPWFVLAFAFAGIYARMIGENLREAMAEDYVRTARAKGISQRRIIWRHGLRSALTPVVTLAALDFGFLLGGAILVETVFNIPGVGRYAFDAIQNSDLPAIQGTVLFGAIFIVLAILVADILYAVLDPRVRY
jgi:peptide/nickel transport system permease protein